MKPDKIPLSVRLLQISCVLFIAGWIFITIGALNNKMYIMGTRLRMSHLMLVHTLFWLIATVGILQLRKWGWAFLLGLALFLFVTTANLLLSPSLRSGALVGFSGVVALFFIWVANLSAVRTTYKVDSTKGATRTGPLKTFGLVCCTAGLFIFFELFTGFRIAPGTAMVRLFVGAIGLVFMLLGMGLLRTSKLALQAVEPFLTFTLLSLGFVLVKDYVDGTRNFQVLKSSFYLALLASMLVFWVLKLRSTASRLAVPQNQAKNK